MFIGLRTHLCRACLKQHFPGVEGKEVGFRWSSGKIWRWTERQRVRCPDHRDVHPKLSYSSETDVLKIVLFLECTFLLRHDMTGSWWTKSQKQVKPPRGIIFSWCPNDWGTQKSSTWLTFKRENNFSGYPNLGPIWNWVYLREYMWRFTHGHITGNCLKVLHSSSRSFRFRGVESLSTNRMHHHKGKHSWVYQAGIQ